ncbi:MAG: ATP-dependent helicase [Chitinispirillaceae bacterium]
MIRRPAVLDSLILNNVQKQAVKYTDGPELVFAGAGTGKTRVLTAKIAYLIEQGIQPSRIFAATFTNKAAREMRLRVEGLVGMPADGLWIGTFHSMCARILRRESSFTGFPPHFTIYDSNDQLSVIKKLLKQFEIDDRTMPPKYLLAVISSCKSSCITPEEYEMSAKGFRDREFAKLYRAYQKALKDQQAMDFDDLLSNTVYLLRGNESVLSRYQDQFKYVLVDEYQDTNKAQFQLVHLLSKNHQKIFAVGDDDQSIYGWRGAMIENILSFEDKFPQTKVFKLEQNYRSTKAILDFANAAIAVNSKRTLKQLWTDMGGGSTVQVSRFRDDRQEAEQVAQKCAALLQKMRGTEIAVLFRTNAQSRAFEEAFRRKRIPYVLVGGTSFYERAEIKNCLAYLRLLVNPKDNVGFERIMNVPARGLGDKSREALIKLAKEKGKSLLETLMSCDTALLGTRAKKGFDALKEIFELLRVSVESRTPPYEVLNEVLQLSGYMDALSQDDSEESNGRIENINELVNALAVWGQENGDKGIAEFLEEVSLASDVDGWARKDNAVNFMTMHCAKGLEFKSVFLVGVEDGIIPSRQNLDDDDKIEEERRLFYVGSTRAMESLECSYVDQRRRFGDILPSEPSRFLRDVPKELFSFQDSTSFFGSLPTLERKSVGAVAAGRKPSAQRARSAQPRPAPQPAYDEFNQDTVEFRMGQYVNHKRYGRGRILNVSGFGDDTKLTVLFNDGARRKLMAKFANLENP